MTRLPPLPTPTVEPPPAKVPVLPPVIWPSVSLRVVEVMATGFAAMSAGVGPMALVTVAIDSEPPRLVTEAMSEFCDTAA
jgi:hypothetical protein